MKNKKLRLLSTCIATISTTFGSLYQISVVSTNNSLNKSSINSESANLVPNTRNLIPFNEIVTGSSIAGHVGYETNEDDKTIRITYANDVSGQNIRFKDRITNVGDKTQTYRLVAIAPRAFSNDVGTGLPAKISGSIDFGSSLKVIGDEAFKNCSSLSGQLIFPQSIESIGDSAFEGCTGFNDSLSLPTNLKYLGSSAFSGCTNISKQVTVGNSITKIYDNTFKDCSRITRIVLPSSLTSIGVSTFSGCSLLSDINIPKNVESIGTYAFNSCISLLNVDLTSKITEISNYLFNGCTKLESVIIPSQVTNIGDYAFQSCSSLKEINLPDELLKINQWAFYNCSSLKSISFPNKLEYIGHAAFSQCTSLGIDSQLFIPETVTEVWPYAFWKTAYKVSTSDKLLYSVDAVGYKKWFIGWTGNVSSTSLPTTITIQNNTYGLAGSALRDVTTLATVNFPTDNVLKYASPSVFYQCTGLTTVNNLDKCINLIWIPNYLFYKCSKLSTQILLPPNLERIGYAAFSDCSALPSVNIPINTVRTTKCSIANYAFQNCVLLGSATGSRIIIPSYVDEIGYNAFTGTSYKATKDDIIYSGDTTGANVWCIGAPTASKSNIVEITLDKNTYGIAGGAFENCTKAVKLSNITSVQFVGPSAFSGCTALKTLSDETFNGKLHKIGDYAFKNCSIFEAPKLLELTNSSLTEVGVEAFLNCAKITGGIALPSTLTKIGASAFNGCKSIVTIVIRDGAKITSFGSQAFANCEAATSASIPNDSISNIKLPSQTFKNCSNLLTFQLPDNLAEIGTSAFENCTKLQWIHADEWPSALKTIGDSAFKGCTILKQVTFNEGLEDIAASAFYDCDQLNSQITIPSTIKSIGASAFAGKNEIPKITFASENPCRLGYNWVDYDTPGLSTIIQIPYGSRNAYFTNNIGVDIEKIRYYDLDPNEFKFKVLNDTLDVVVNTIKAYEGDALFSISVNKGASDKVKYSIEPDQTEGSKTLPEWISIDEDTGTIFLENPGTIKKYYFKITATSVQDPNISETRSISINVFKNTIADNWWIWLIVVVSCVGVIILLAWLMIIITRKDNKKNK